MEVVYMESRFHLIIIGALSFFILITGCASSKNVGDLSASLSEGYMPTEEEIWAEKQANKLHDEFVSKGMIYSKPEIDSYLTRVKNRLLTSDVRVQNAIQIYVLRSPAANAMALPNGNIYIYSGLFSYLETEDQLAAVLAHEIAHVTERHSVKSLVDRKNTLVGAHIADLLTGGLGLVYFPAISSLMAYSREIESEADENGLKVLQAAEYNPAAMRELLEIFKSLPGAKNRGFSAYSSHPTQDLRIQQINKQISANKYSKVESSRPDEFSISKGSLMKKNVNMRLRSRHYKRALDIIDKTEKYYTEEGVVSFYRAEAYLGMMKHPEDAAIEKYWIETGKFKKKNKYLTVFLEDKEKNRNLAEKLYKEAINLDKPYVVAMKRLGEVNKIKNNKALALQWYEKYLSVSPDAPDRKSVEREIQRLNIIKGQ